MLLLPLKGFQGEDLSISSLGQENLEITQKKLEPPWEDKHLGFPQWLLQPNQGTKNIDIKFKKHRLLFLRI